MKKFIIVYNGTVTPFSAASKEDLEKRIQKDWSKASNGDSNEFESCGININFGDYANGKVAIYPLATWYRNNVK